MDRKYDYNTTVFGLAVTLTGLAAPDDSVVMTENPEEIRKRIARAVALKPQRHHEAEVLFMREFLGMTRIELAHRLRVADELIERIEEGSNPVSSSIDLSLRYLVLERLGDTLPSPSDVLDWCDMRSPPDMYVIDISDLNGPDSVAA